METLVLYTDEKGKFHGDAIVLTREEAQALYDQLKNEWINRDNPIAYQLINQIGDWLASFEVQK